VSDREGDIPINPNSLERHGNILEFLLPRGRAVHYGRWRWGYNTVEVNLHRLSDGRSEVDRESHMEGRWYGKELVFHAFNQLLYGQTTEFRFTRSDDNDGFGWKEALLVGGVLIALGAIFGGGDEGTPAEANEPIRIELQEQLDRFAQAWSLGDMRAVEAMIPDGFLFYDANGTEYDRATFLDSVQRRVQAVQEAKVTAKLRELSVKPDSAIGVVRLRTTGRVTDWWNETHDLEVIEAARMYWRKPDDTWRLRTARSLRVEQKVDGNVVTGPDPWEGDKPFDDTSGS
jgi:hypothetical protein